MKKNLTAEDLAAIAAAVEEKVEKTIGAYEKKRQQENRRQQREQSREKKAKDRLTAYRRVKATLDDTVTFTEDEMVELRWKFVEDLMGSALEFTSKGERQIADMEEKRKQDMYSCQMIERAVDFYRRECESSPYPEDIRRYREVYALYMQKQPTTVKEISTVENVSEKTVYKDLSMAYKAIGTYLLGV